MRSVRRSWYSILRRWAERRGDVLDEPARMSSQADHAVGSGGCHQDGRSSTSIAATHLTHQ